MIRVQATAFAHERHYHHAEGYRVTGSGTLGIYDTDDSIVAEWAAGQWMFIEVVDEDQEG